MYPRIGIGYVRFLEREGAQYSMVTEKAREIGIVDFSVEKQASALKSHKRLRWNFSMGMVLLANIYKP